MIDIIIPAYNNGKLLHRALSSIAAQTARDKCIVTVVDDCSEEDLREIVKPFKPFIKIQYIKLPENKKYPGLVRQVGLDNTNAPYVMFLDSDDMLAPQAIELVSAEMRSTNADMIIGYFYRQNKNTYQIMDDHSTTWLHGNIYKRKFLEDNEITFTAGYNEDGAFNTQCYMLSDKINILKTPISYWMDNENSLTREKDLFTYYHGPDLATTLTHAYKNIIEKQPTKLKIFSNLGTHWALFHKLCCDYKNLIKDNDLEKEYRTFVGAIMTMVDELNMNKFTSIQKEAFKKGFISGFMKYRKEKITLSVSDFLSISTLKYSINMEDFFGGINNENSNN